MADPIPMPTPAERRAPKFEGDGRTLIQFLRDYKRCADAAKLTDQEAIEQIVTYVSTSVRADIEQFDEYEDAAMTSWDNFKKRLLKDYPNAVAPKEYTKDEYAKFVEGCASRTVTTEDQLADFTREFRRHSSKLVKNGRITAEDSQRDYYLVLSRNLGQRLELKLMMKDKDKRTDQFTIDEIFTESQTIIKNNRLDKASIATSPAVHTQESSVKKEDAMLVLLTQIKDELARRQAPPAQQMRSSVQGQSTGGPANAAATYSMGGCYYEGGAHSMRDCPFLKADLESGRCIRNDRDEIVYPNGEPIRGGPGVKLKDRIDEFHKQNPDFLKKSVKPAASAMLVEIGESYFDKVTVHAPQFETKDAEDAWYAVMSQTLTAIDQRRAGIDAEAYSVVPGERKQYGLRSKGPVVGNTGKVDQTAKDQPPHLEKGVVDRMPPRPATPAMIPAAAHPTKATRPSATIEEIPDEDAPVAAPVPRVPPVPHASAVPKRPQFRLHSQLENDGLTKIIHDRILESKVVMTVEELLAISPSLRKYWKDQSATKRVTVGFAGTGAEIDPASGAEIFQYRATNDAGLSRDLIASEHSLPLRYLDCDIGQYTVEGVVDSGAMLVIISRQLWEDLGKPIDISRRMSLEAANNTTARTLGLCANLEVKVAGLTFYLQAHVVEDAPFSLLLGRPFLSLARACEEHRDDGMSIITLHDPNSNRAARIPTKTRSRSAEKAQDF